MCGVAGIVGAGFATHDLRTRLSAMRDRLRHRGPDDQGEYFDDAAGTGLVHTRLAILDLSEAGHQPMASRDGRYTIVFNGEIYNFRALRAELEQQGETFRTESDTEVLLRLYQREGAACVKKLDGMFAFAIWDRLEQACFLARDPLGIKPLYLWRRGETLAFASEVRALLQAELGPKWICACALYEYFLYGSVQEPRTLVENIEALPAGHTLLWRNGKGTPAQYWELRFGSEVIERQEAIELTRSALEESIRRHFVSDVPVGIFLSGGIDSTAVVALAKSCGFERPKTLCISFNDPAYNEGAMAAETAKLFGTEHYDWRMTAEDGRRLVDGFLKSFDQPSTDGFNTYCVAKLAHEQGLKVVLSGVGGDELFGSYSSFAMIPPLVAWHRRLNRVGPLAGVAGRLGERVSGRPKWRRLSHYLQSSGSVAEAYWAVRGFFTPAEARRLVKCYVGRDVDGELGDIAQNSMPEQPTIGDEISYLETTRYMRNQLLRDSDVMSMAWRLELRTPLVDRKLVDAVGRVPAGRRLAAGKRLLLAAVPEIPAYVAEGRKRGFRFPFEQWVRDEWREMFEEIETESPVRLGTWYRQWCLFMLNQFLRANEFAGPSMVRAPNTRMTREPVRVGA